MQNIFHKGYAVRFIIESALLDGDPLDQGRYYSVDATVNDDALEGVASVVTESNGKQSLLRMKHGVRSIETRELNSSDMSATLFFNGDSEVAQAIYGRIRNQDHMRVEITDGNGYKVAFDGFVDMRQTTRSSSPSSFRNELTLSACGIKQVLDQSWFNWQGAVKPAEDVFTQNAGQSLLQKLGEKSLPAEEIIKDFLSAGTGILSIKAGQDPIFPGDFFVFGQGSDFQSAFQLSYPQPAMVYHGYAGPLWGLIQDLADPDIHECFFGYRPDPASSGREKPTLIFRPRPFPGKAGDDDRWKALPIIKIGDGSPAATMIAEERRSQPHPNAFHWASAESDQSMDDQASKLTFGFWIDKHGINRYGYSAKAVASRLAPLGSVDPPHKTWLDQVAEILERVAWQDAPLPNLLSRTIHVPLLPGVRPGMVLEDHTDPTVVTGYIVSVTHRIQANPFSAKTVIGAARCFPATAEDYPDKVRATVDIVKSAYIEGNTSGSATAAQTAAVQKAQPPANCQCSATAPSMPSVPYGQAIVNAAKAHNIPAWALAHTLRSESGIGTNPSVNTPGPSGDLGIAQFTPIAVLDLYQQGYRNSDGSVFTHPVPLSGHPEILGDAVLDPCKSIDACAFYLSFIAGKIKGAGLIADLIAAGTRTYNGQVVLYAWTLYGYNLGWPTATINGHAQNWAFSSADMARVQFGNYWGFNAVQGGMSAFGGLS